MSYSDYPNPQGPNAAATGAADYNARIAALQYEMATTPDPNRRAYLEAVLRQTVAEHDAKQHRLTTTILIAALAVVVVVAVVVIVVLTQRPASTPTNPLPSNSASVTPTPSDLTPTPTPLPMPGVVGLTEAMARQMISDAGLDVTVNTDSGPADSLGTVLRQDPAAGTQLPPGSTVTIWVNGGSGTCTVPQGIVGSYEMDARTALKNAGFTNIPNATTAPLGTDEPATIAAGQVLTVNPGMGSTASCDGPVMLTLATGKAQIPDLWGMSADQATSFAGAQGFQVSSQSMDYDVNNCNSQAGTVCRQTPAAGSYDFRGTTIVISIAGAPPK